MEPLEYYYEPINRNAFIVKPKAPFFNWFNHVFSDEEPMHQLEENNIYLIREMASNEDILKWIKKNFSDIFINELNDWCADKNLWPGNLTYKMFCDWFDVEVHSMVLDLEETEVRKD